MLRAPNVKTMKLDTFGAFLPVKNTEEQAHFLTDEEDFQGDFFLV